MNVFRYYLGFVHIVYHQKKGFWNQDKKKWVNNMAKATYYKNAACAKNKCKELGRNVKYVSCRIEIPEWW